MLEPWIIEQIRRREEEERRRNERPQLEVPVHDDRWKHPSGDEDDRQKDRDKDKDDEGSERGVVIIDFSGF
jgi:hypothetical protein